MGLKDLNRERALYVYCEYEEDIIKDIDKEKLRGYSRKLPMMILTNGLISTIAFYEKKSKDDAENKENTSQDKKAYVHVISVLKKWLAKNFDLRKDSIVIDLCQKDNFEYNLITKEAIAVSEWMKNLTENFEIKKNKDDEKE